MVARSNAESAVRFAKEKRRKQIEKLARELFVRNYADFTDAAPAWLKTIVNAAEAFYVEIDRRNE